MWSLIENHHSKTVPVPEDVYCAVVFTYLHFIIVESRNLFHSLLLLIDFQGSCVLFPFQNPDKNPKPQKTYCNSNPGILAGKRFMDGLEKYKSNTKLFPIPFKPQPEILVYKYTQLNPHSPIIMFHLFPILNQRHHGGRSNSGVVIFEDEEKQKIFN